MKRWEFRPARDLELSPGERLRSVQRENSLLESITHLGWWSLVRYYLLFGHRLTVTGRHHLPAQPPFIMIANHSSHLDALVLGSIFPWSFRSRVFSLAAADAFFETPAISVFAAFAVNALPLRRKNFRPQDLEMLRQRLIEERCIYILFPEGKRSRDGRMSPFKTGIARLVAGTSVPVVPCAVSGGFRALPPHRILPRPEKIVLRIGRPLVFSEAPQNRQGWHEITSALQSAVRELAEV